MKQHQRLLVRLALAGMLAAGILPSAAQADTGTVRVLFTKGGFIFGVGGGSGTLTFHKRSYPFKVSGVSVGFTIGASTTQLTGRVLNLHRPADLQGTYAVIGAGGALAAGAGGMQLQNDKGVILQLSGLKAGVEVSAAVGGVTITF